MSVIVHYYTHRICNTYDTPELTDLVTALDDLPASKVRYLCILLGVGEGTLEQIDANPDALARIPKYLQAWLDRDENTTWTSIVDALRSRKLSKCGLADKITRKYCPVYTNINPVASSSQSSDVSNSLKSNSDDEEGSVPSFVSASSQPDSRPDSIEHELQFDPTQLPTVSKLSLSPNGKKDKSIGKKVHQLAKGFRSVVVNANIDLSLKGMSPEKLYRFKVDLTKLPMLTEYKKLRFLQKKKKKILRAKYVDAVFEILDPYWNYIDYSLLEHIVNNYCDRDVKIQMQIYIEDLHKFERATSVKQLTSAVPDNRVLISNYSTLTATLGVDAEKCSLYRARKVKDAIIERACLQSYVPQLLSLHASSVVLTIAFPKKLSKHIRKSLDRTFLLEHDIIPESIEFNDKPSPQHAPGKSHSTAFQDSAEMPDPPQNVREEVSCMSAYTMYCTVITFNYIHYR